MNWREAWLSYFPDWPSVLLDRFQQAIQIDLAKLNGSDELGFYPWFANIVGAESGRLQTIQQKNITASNPNAFSYALFNGGPAKYQTTWQSGSFEFLQSFQIITDVFGWPMEDTRYIYIKDNVSVIFDSRLWQWPIWFHYGAAAESILFWVPTFTLYHNIGFNSQPYNGADTIHALHENGVDNGGVDYSALADFLDYRNAFTKYGQQIAAQKAADQQQQKNDLRYYETELADKLQAEKNALQNLTLSMRQAMKNEAASAERDMVNTVINAQNLKLSLLAAMR